MQSGWMEFESFCVYPPTTNDVFRVNATLLDLVSGRRRVLKRPPSDSSSMRAEARSSSPKRRW